MNRTHAAADLIERIEPMRREDFPVLDQEVHGKPLVYFDSAATTQKPRQVIESMVRYYEQDNSNVHRGLHELSRRATDAYEAARERVAKFINAPSRDCIVFTRGTTEAVNLVANSWGRANVEAGDALLLTEMEHHSNIVPWQLLANLAGASVAYVPVIGDEGRLDIEGARRLIEQKPRIFAFTHVSNTLGSINPVRDLCEHARKHGVITLVDAAQSAGHLPLDVQEIGCDFLAFSGHKMCGPTGVGVLYGRADLLEQMPPWQGGGEMISRVFFDHSDFKPAPYRFEAGTPPIAQVIGLAAAIDYLDEIGKDRIFAHDSALAGLAYARLAEVPGIRLLGPASGRSALVTFGLGDAHAHDVVTLADQHGLALRGGHHCNQPLMRKLGLPSSVRASFYFYNSSEEVDRLVAAIHEIRNFFAHGH